MVVVLVVVVAPRRCKDQVLVVGVVGFGRWCWWRVDSGLALVMDWRW
jgi:hypothetical protein